MRWPRYPEEKILETVSVTAALKNALETCLFASEKCVRRLEAEKSLDLTGLRGQDAQAFGELVRMHEPVIAGLCQSMGLFGADLEDAMAEAFAAIYRAVARNSKDDRR